VLSLGHQQTRKKSLGDVLLRLLPWVLGVALAPGALGSFIGEYAPERFTLTNVSADGYVTTAGDGASILLTGGNLGSGVQGITDFTIAAAGAGMVWFDYMYSSLDMPGFDSAAYLVGDLVLGFADTDGQSGTISFPVSVGELFGWRVATLDNTGEPGTLIVSGFSAPSDTSIPEPGTFLLAFMGMAALAAQRIRNRSNRISEENR